ncbi:MAG: hypothetical protein ACT4ON_13300 [Bacteroidota bacterium]
MDLKKMLSPDALVNPITQLLKKKLGKKDLEIDNVSSVTDLKVYSFTAGEGGIYISDEENSRTEFIIPLLKAPNDEPYWIGFSLILKKINKKPHYYLYHVGIRIYQGQVTSDQKRKVLRAEWMIDEGTKDHAQPHWHVHNIFPKQLNELKPPKKFVEEETIVDFNLENQTDINPTNTLYNTDELKAFHFAMSSQWHKKASHNNILGSQNELIQWLDGCIDYIVNQLQYISKSIPVLEK